MAHAHANPGEVINLSTFGEDKSTALVKEKRFEVLRLLVEAGKSIPEHKVDGPITVQCLSGKCTFCVGTESRELTPGSWLYLTGGALHSVDGGEETSVLLVTILFAKDE